MTEEVRAAVQKYVDGCVAADPKAVRDAFDENATMWGYLGDDYVTMSGEEFAANVVGSAEPATGAYTANIHGIEITGNVASAILEEEQFLGANFRNHFGLLRRDGAWRIVSKVFTTV
ncbi:nuclear transport factor 2 family protein [Leucobacter viscericola]|uniref:Nuclear transport factor 2 family protein n=1 Tax=Leucobacter viscericola TaxID=2714935 RepID=A0A6G7XIE3_9MICO|nr:nuclear transport factor 2 family protein [Leucobacter viscericola]QIK64313.1 nuclear transport factor 2 family protein [Leucobacter viscericola]